MLVHNQLGWNTAWPMIGSLGAKHFDLHFISGNLDFPRDLLLCATHSDEWVVG